MTTVQLPEPLRPLLSRIEALARDCGAVAHAVGGSVRDALLDRPMRDLDIAVDRDALAFARVLADDLTGHFVELDDVHAIARIVLDAGEVAYIDVAQLQGSLVDDLRRRDFTVDAMAAPLGGGEIIDPCGGTADAGSGLVRMTAPGVFDSDPLRMLRGVRLAGELAFTIEPATGGAIRERAARLNEAAAERRRDELARIFALERAGPALRSLDALGLLDQLLPELADGRGVTQPENHHVHDVFEHNIHAVEAMDLMLAARRPAAENAWMWDDLWRVFGWWEDGLRAYLTEPMSEGRTRGALLKFTALLHDIAKPETRTVDAGGRIRFLGHSDVGAQVAGRIMRRLRFSTREVAFVTTLVEEHLRPVQLAQVGEAPTRRALYRFHRALGNAAPAVLLLALADGAASSGDRLTREGWSAQAAYMNSLVVRLVEDEGILDPPRILTGDDITSELGLAPGPLIGELLESLREAQAMGDITDRNGALALARQKVEEQNQAMRGDPAR